MRLLLSRWQLHRERNIVVSILIAGLLNGLLFTFLMPPWQHYDEPSHFEYAWLLANRDGLPEVGEYDQAMRREVAASMVEHDFFAGLGARPNLVSQTEPVWIGISQTNDPPLYYLLASLPLRLVRTSDITFQLYLARLISVCLYLVTILGSYLMVRELTKPTSVLLWLVPATMIMLPGFSDLMTSVNNDVGAVAVFSIFLWLCSRAIRRSKDWLSLVGMTAMAVLCFLTKNTVMIAIPLALFAGLFAVFRDRQRVVAWSVLGLVALAMLIFSLRWDGAIAWYQQEMGGTFIHQKESEEKLLGERCLRFSVPQSSQIRVVQPLSIDQVEELRGEIVTVGAWMWATDSMQASTPILSDGVNEYFKPIEISSIPTYFLFQVLIPKNAERLMVVLDPPSLPQSGEIYFDNVVMLKGDYKETTSDTVGGTSGDGGLLISNLVENSSFEEAWLGVTPEIERHLVSWLPFEPSQVFSSLSKWDSAGWYYRATIENLFRTFWAKFGWGHISMAGQKPYRVLFTATLLGGIGAVAAFWRLKRELSLEMWTFLGIAIMAVWVAAILRGVGSLIGEIFIPGARYAYPVIILSLLFVCVGWRELIQRLEKFLHVPAEIQYGIYFVCFLLLDVLSIYAIVHYYSGVP